MKKTVIVLSLFGFLISGGSAQAVREGARSAPLTTSEESAGGVQAARTASDTSNAQGTDTVPGASLSLKRIVIFSSGLAYYEHSGNLSGPARLSLPFKTGEVNDALKSLVLNDPASANPAVTYQSEQTLLQTLRSLRIDLSGEPDMALILSRLKGAEVEIFAPGPAGGRILGVEYRTQTSSPIGGETIEPWLKLYSAGGLKMFNFKEISSINFKDPAVNEDLNRALDLIASSRQVNTRSLEVLLPGGGARQVSLSYVLPSPVWKVSYRLDLGTGNAANAGNASHAFNPLFQGWAIVDNDGDTDWNNVELSLAAGRPASFIQNLYPPYYVQRPVMPLAIAGAAAAVTHDSGYAASTARESPQNYARNAPAAMAKVAEMDEWYAVESEAAYPQAPAPSVAGGAITGAQGAAAGDQFEFTIKTPVSLDRRMSAMLPLTESRIEGRKLLIFSGAASQGRSIHPRLGAEITNTTGMKLPAGPITVYDGGIYAGDALIEFWNENEKRLISFGEDLSVTGTVMDTSARLVTAVTVSGGVMTISRSQTYNKTYTFRNTASQPKQIMVEHPKTSGTTLESPEADEQTASAYRFTMTVPSAGRDLVLMVSEVRSLSERITLLSQRPETLLSYATNQEIPSRVRAALQQASDLRRAVTGAEAAVTENENRRVWLISEQDRVRKNVEAAGRDTQQGQEYLRRLASLDGEIDGLVPKLEEARSAVKAAQKAYEDYLNGLNL